MADLSKAAWDARAMRLNRMTKTQLIDMYRRGIKNPYGSLVRYGGGAHPPEHWRKDEVVNTILAIEFPGGPRHAERHDYSPTERVGNPCERCGFGRHHSWHS